MADNFTVSVQIDFIIATLGSFSVIPAQVNGIPKYQITRVTLANGDNTFPIPSGANFCLIIFDPGSGTTKKIKGAIADTGITLNVSTMPVLIPVASGNVIINSSALDGTLITQVIFF